MKKLCVNDKRQGIVICSSSDDIKISKFLSIEEINVHVQVLRDILQVNFRKQDA